LRLGNKDIRETKTQNGVLRAISAGTGVALRFTNLDTGKTFSTQSKGAAEIDKLNADLSQTIVLTGFSTLLLFPTDSPPGPSTTLYAGGRVVFSIDTGGNATVLEESGNKIDICAALS
jgi:hypothetical protein